MNFKSDPKTRREKEIWQACDDLWAIHGQWSLLTGDSIREQLLELGYKKGSPNETYKYRKTWQESRGVFPDNMQEDFTDTKSDPISRAVQLVHEQLRSEAKVQIEELEKKHAESQDSLLNELGKLKSAYDLQRQEHQTLLSQLGQSKKECENLLLKNGQLEKECAKLGAELSTTHKFLSELKKETQCSRQELQEELKSQKTTFKTLHEELKLASEEKATWFKNQIQLNAQRHLEEINALKLEIRDARKLREKADIELTKEKNQSEDLKRQLKAIENERLQEQTILAFLKKNQDFVSQRLETLKGEFKFLAKTTEIRGAFTKEHSILLEKIGVLELMLKSQIKREKGKKEEKPN